MKKIVLGVLAGVLVGLGLAVIPSGAVMADALNLCEDEEFKRNNPDLWEAAGCHDADDEDGRNKTIFEPVKVMIEVVLGGIGILGVIVIIYGGASYTISTGDAAKVNKAKNIILYGVIGLVVALFAYVIVEFVSKSIFG